MEGGEWETCNDDGFIYKRRKRNHHPDTVYQRPPEESEEEIRRNKLARRKASLLAVREKYRKEIEKLEVFAVSLMEDIRLGDLGSRVEEENKNSTLKEDTNYTERNQGEEISAPGNSFRSLIEELILQVEAQEAVLKKLSNICDIADSVCNVKEDAMMESFLGLPVWESPQFLMASLVD